jgi:hypothetical protein
MQALLTLQMAAAAAAAPAPASAGAAGAAAAAGTFPDSFPNAVKHFLLLGSIGMLAATLFFLYFAGKHRGARIINVITFFFVAVSTLSYYSMFSGMGVVAKTGRTIFWGHYIDLLITMPVPPPLPPPPHPRSSSSWTSSSSPKPPSPTPSPSLATTPSWSSPPYRNPPPPPHPKQLLGAVVAAPYSWVWYAASVVFFAIVVTQLWLLYNDAVASQSATVSELLKTLVIITVIAWSVYPVVWLLGQVPPPPPRALACSGC